MKLQRANKFVLSLFSTGILFLYPLAALSQTEDRSPRHGVAPWNIKAVSSRNLEIGGATIQVDFASGTLALDPASILPWIQEAAHAVSNYYGRFPVRRVRILIVPVPGARGIVQGTTWGDVGGVPGFTRIRLGQYTTEEDQVRAKFDRLTDGKLDKALAREISAIGAAYPTRPLKVTVVIPARNEAEHIADTLRSLLTQQFDGELRIVLVDNSSDGTGAVARELTETDDRLRVVDGEPLKTGWTGKKWAVSQGLRQAETLAADYVLL